MLMLPPEARPLLGGFAAAVLAWLPPDRPVAIAVDDTTTQHKGPKVWGKGRHRDHCRFTHTHTVWVFGHKWIVLAILLRLPFASRPWALPVLAALYHPKPLNRKERRRHNSAFQFSVILRLTALRALTGSAQKVRN